MDLMQNIMNITFLKRQVQPLLQSFVKEYWYIRVQSEAALLPMPLTAVPEQCLYFYPKQLPTASTNCQIFNAQASVIKGQQILRQNISVPNDYLMFKVMLQPSGLFRLLGTPMTHFADTHEDLTLVLGKEITEVKEKIEETEDFDTMIKVVESFLLKKAQNSKIEQRPIDKAIQAMEMPFSIFSLDRLAEDACLSNRQFERKFMERIGVTPKLYSRLIRFHQAMKLRQQFPKQSWLKIAYECNYFDHNHLLRDFKLFTGEVPIIFDFKNAVIY